MYCSNCGCKNEGNSYCVECGNKLVVNDNNVNSSVKKKNNNGLRIASIILGSIGIFLTILIFTSPLGLIVSIVGLILSIVAFKDGRNILGVVLNAIAIFLFILMVNLIVYFIGNLVNYGQFFGPSYDEEYYDYDDYYDEYYY